jgi:hypothetical protein
MRLPASTLREALMRGVSAHTAAVARGAEAVFRDVPGKGWNGRSGAAEVRSILCFLPARGAVVVEGVELVAQALSDGIGEAMVMTDAQGGPFTALHRRHLTPVGLDHGATVPTVRPNDLVEQRGIETIHLLEIDIEGHELYALRNASAVLVHGAGSR